MFGIYRVGALGAGATKGRKGKGKEYLVDGSGMACYCVIWVNLHGSSGMIDSCSSWLPDIAV